MTKQSTKRPPTRSERSSITRALLIEQIWGESSTGKVKKLMRSLNLNEAELTVTTNDEWPSGLISDTALAVWRDLDWCVVFATFRRSWQIVFFCPASELASVRESLA